MSFWTIVDFSAVTVIFFCCLYNFKLAQRYMKKCQAKDEALFLIATEAKEIWVSEVSVEALTFGLKGQKLKGPERSARTVSEFRSHIESLCASSDKRTCH